MHMLSLSRWGGAQRTAVIQGAREAARVALSFHAEVAERGVFVLTT